MTLHLTHEQLCDLLLADSSSWPESEFQNDSDVVQAHLRACPVCSAELKILRDSIAHFRDASASYARQEFAQSYAQRSSIAPPHSFLTQPLYWTGAAVVFVAALFPLSMRRQQHPISAVTASSGSSSVQTMESDEALLADIDQKVSADMPSAMEPLADPTAGSALSTSAADQRKD
jgi:hypothetical protein